MNNIKKARAKTRAAQELADSESESEDPEPKKGTGSSWNYNEVRLGFLASLKEQGYKFVDAKAQWDKSEEKRQLLSSLSLPELKRRKFVDKQCTVHPWV